MVASNYIIPFFISSSTGTVHTSRPIWVMLLHARSDCCESLSFLSFVLRSAAFHLLRTPVGHLRSPSHRSATVGGFSKKRRCGSWSSCHGLGTFWWWSRCRGQRTLPTTCSQAQLLQYQRAAPDLNSTASPPCFCLHLGPFPHTFDQQTQPVSWQHLPQLQHSRRKKWLAGSLPKLELTDWCLRWLAMHVQAKAILYKVYLDAQRILRCLLDCCCITLLQNLLLT